MKKLSQKKRDLLCEVVSEMAKKVKNVWPENTLFKKGIYYIKELRNMKILRYSTQFLSESDSLDYYSITSTHFVELFPQLDHLLTCDNVLEEALKCKQQVTLMAEKIDSFISSGYGVTEYDSKNLIYWMDVWFKMGYRGDRLYELLHIKYCEQNIPLHKVL